MTPADSQERKPPVQGGKKSLGKRLLRVFLRCVAVVCILILSGCAIGALWYRRALERGGYLESWAEDDGRILTGLSYGEGEANRYDQIGRAHV